MPEPSFRFDDGQWATLVSVVCERLNLVVIEMNAMGQHYVSTGQARVNRDKRRCAARFPFDHLTFSSDSPKRACEPSRRARAQARQPAASNSRVQLMANRGAKQ